MLTSDGWTNDEMKSLNVISFCVQSSSVYFDPISIGTVLSPATDAKYSKLFGKKQRRNGQNLSEYLSFQFHIR